MTFSLQSIINRMDRRLKDISDVPIELWYDQATDLNQFLYNEMIQVDPDRFIVPQVYNVSASPSTQPLPDDFRDIQPSNCGFFIRNSAGNDTRNRLYPSGFGAAFPGYYFDNSGNVVFTGINTPQVIVLRYIPILDDITSPADTFVVPDENKEVVELGMVARYYRDEEDPQQAAAEQDFVRVLSVFLSRLKKSPNIFQMPTSINSGA